MGTMGFPIIMLFVMIGRTVSLEGSQEGIQQYLSSDMNVLVSQPDVWPKAVGQVFFSLGITFGIMTAYGSHCHRVEPALMGSCVIAISNSLYSFVAGFAVFSALGRLAFLEDVPISELNISGFGLVFGSWPVVLGSLPSKDATIQATPGGTTNDNGSVKFSLHSTAGGSVWPPKSISFRFSS